MTVRQVSLQAAGVISRRGLLALAILWIGRQLGPQDLGTFSYVFTWIYTFALVAGLGLTPVSTREIAKGEHDAQELMSTAVILRLVFAAAAVVIINALFATPLLRKGNVGQFVLAMSLAIPAISLIEQLAAYAMGYARNGAFALIQGTQWGLFLIGTLVAIRFTHRLDLLFIVQACTFWIALAPAIIASRVKFERSLRLWTYDRKLIPFLIRESAPLAITSVLGILSFRMGTFILFNRMGASTTGQYTSALQVVESLQLIPMAIVGACYPAICQAAKESLQFSHILQRVMLVLGFMSAAVIVIVSLAGGRLVLTLFGARFSGGGEVLTILIWSSLPMFLHYSLTFFIIALHRQRIFILESLVYLAISLAGNLILVSRFGLMGATYTAVCAEAALLLMHLTFLRWFTEVRVKLWTIVLPITMAFAAAIFLGPWRAAINASVVQSVLFSSIACLIFGGAFLLCWRNLDKLKPPGDAHDIVSREYSHEPAGL